MWLPESRIVRPTRPPGVFPPGGVVFVICNCISGENGGVLSAFAVARLRPSGCGADGSFLFSLGQSRGCGRGSPWVTPAVR